MKRLLTFAGCILALGSACATGHVNSDPTLAERSGSPPEWVQKGSGAYQSVEAATRDFMGLGRSENKNPGLRRTEAHDRAQAEVRRQFHAFAAALLAGYLKSRPDAEELEEQPIETAPHTDYFGPDVLGIQIVDEWIRANDGTMFALATLSLDWTLKNIEQKAEKQLGEDGLTYMKNHAPAKFDELARQERQGASAD